MEAQGPANLMHQPMLMKRVRRSRFLVIPAKEDVTQLTRRKTVVKFCPIARDSTETPPLMVGRKGAVRRAFSSKFEKTAGFSQPDPKDVNWITSSKAGAQGKGTKSLDFRFRGNDESKDSSCAKLEFPDNLERRNDGAFDLSIIFHNPFQ